MKPYRFKANATAYQVVLHRLTLKAAIKYKAKRQIDCSEEKEELAAMQKFYNLTAKTQES